MEKDPLKDGGIGEAEKIVVITPDSDIPAEWGGPGEGPGEFRELASIAWMEQGVGGSRCEGAVDS